MIKIINVTSDHNIGGAGRCILTFLDTYDRSQFEIVVVVPRGSALIPHIESTKTRYIEIDGMEDLSYSKIAVKELKKVFKNEKPDGVHAHASFSARIAAKLCGIPVVYTRHSVFPNKPSVTKGIGKLINGLSNNLTANKIIAVAGAAKDNLTESGVSDKKIIVIKNGVKPLKFYSDEEKLKAKEFYGVKDSSLIFAMVARIEDIKGHEYFIDAAKEVIKKYSDAKFMICGTGSYEKTLKDKVDIMGLNDTVMFTGYIKDVTSIMNVLDVNVNASYGTEATSLSLLEGMSIGKPIIASNYGGNPELVEDGVNGLLFESRNSDQLANAMIKVAQDRELYNKLSKGALKLYNEKYTAEINARNIENVYKLITKGVK